MRSLRGGLFFPRMVDVLTPEQRRRNMSRIGGKNTGPELFLRRLVHSMGYRYRLHRRDLPGKPDLVFSSRNKVIFVHGCYWHVHTCRYGQVRPATNAQFWQKKRANTVLRDRRNLQELKSRGWTALVVWECEMRKGADLEDRIRRFLQPEED